MIKKILAICLFVLMFSFTANAMTVTWDAYTDTAATGLRIYKSTDQGGPWTVLVDNIPTSDIASEIPDGPDNTRIYYIMRAYDANGKESDNSNTVSYYWTTGGQGEVGPAAVGNIKLLDCTPYDNESDDGTPEWTICHDRYQP